MKVYIAQLLCPGRHCVLGVANAYPSEAEAEVLGQKLQNQFNAMVATHRMNPWCGVCGARTLIVEVRETRFASMEEALPELRNLEEAQRQSREWLRRSRN